MVETRRAMTDPDALIWVLTKHRHDPDPPSAAERRRALGRRRRERRLADECQRNRELLAEHHRKLTETLEQQAAYHRDRVQVLERRR